MVKLTEQDVLELRGLYRDGGWSLVRLAERYHVSASTIQKAIKGLAWPHVDGPTGRTDNRAKLTEQDVLELRRLYRGELTVQRLAERYGISRSAACAGAGLELVPRRGARGLIRLRPRRIARPGRSTGGVGRGIATEEPSWGRRHHASLGVVPGSIAAGGSTTEEKGVSWGGWGRRTRGGSREWRRRGKPRRSHRSGSVPGAAAWPASAWTLRRRSAPRAITSAGTALAGSGSLSAIPHNRLC